MRYDGFGWFVVYRIFLISITCYMTVTFSPWWLLLFCLTIVWKEKE